MRAILAGDDTVGRKILALMPSARAAKATATPWLPPEAAVTPAAGIFRSSRLAKAPRALNDPECCSSSSLSTSRIGASPKSAPSTTTTGVSRTWPRMRANASVIAAGLIDASMILHRLRQRAVVVEQLLARAGIVGRRIDVAGEQDEAARHTDRDQGPVSYVLARRRNASGQHLERIDADEIAAVEPHRQIAMAVDRLAEVGPALRHAGGVPREIAAQV